MKCLAVFLLARGVLGIPPPPGDGESSSNGQNVHVTFGCNSGGADYDVEFSILYATLVHDSVNISYYGDWWTTFGTSTDVDDGYCDTTAYTDSIYFTTHSFDGVSATESSDGYASLTSNSVANHDMENYCSAEGGATPPLIGSGFTTSYSNDFPLAPSNTYISDISNEVGWMVNGVVIFSPFTGASTVAAEDETLDTCVGY